MTDTSTGEIIGALLVNAEQRQHVDALSRLALSGFSGEPIGNPAAPEGLVYLRDRGLFVDAVLVTGPADAFATRRNTLGSVVRTERGAVAEVVAEVLTW